MAKKGKKDKQQDRRDAPVELGELVPVAAGDASATGARLCYGEPVRESGRTIIPVAREDGRPLGYIEVDAAGSRYVALSDPVRERVLTGLVGLVAALLGALTGAAFGRRRGR